MKSVSVVVEKPYSEAELKRLKRVFAELREASKTKEAKAYVKEVEARLKV